LSAVSLAWVFFRADTLGAAWSMLQGLTGAHGLLSDADFILPTTLLRDLGMFGRFLQDAGLSFADTPGTLSPRVFLWIPALTIIALALPNSQQTLANFLPSRDGSRRSGALRPAAWRPDLTWGIATGMLVLASIILRSHDQEFLYFQF
jgi:hypothetical protein